MRNFDELKIYYQRWPGNPDILLVDKPADMSSFDVIRWLRRELGIKKMGHAGTLDPFASGLLVVATGQATKELAQMIKLDKVYEATMLLGQTTPTLDPEGELSEVVPVPASDSDIEKAIEGLVGTHDIPVPLYSAIKVDGKPLYKYARAGQRPPRIPVRSMQVYNAELQGVERHDNGTVSVRAVLAVASGTYIRSLAGWVGGQIGAPAMLTALRRTRVGSMDLPGQHS